MGFVDGQQDALYGVGQSEDGVGDGESEVLIVELSVGASESVEDGLEQAGGLVELSGSQADACQRCGQVADHCQRTDGLSRSGRSSQHGDALSGGEATGEFAELRAEVAIDHQSGGIGRRRKGSVTEVVK